MVRSGRIAIGTEEPAMTVIIQEPYLAERIRAEREATDGAKHDEVWDGVYIVSPLPNVQHQILAQFLWQIFQTVVSETGDGLAINGVNVSDREEGWAHNYREPDVAVVLKANPAKICEAHVCGGPDFLVEILSRGDQAREKRGFYAKIGVRELLILDRDPWELELYRLDGGELKLVGKSTLDEPETLTSAVLPLSFRLIPGEVRPIIAVSRSDGTQTWTV
jgi:Uma2 family endonuclease